MGILKAIKKWAIGDPPPKKKAYTPRATAFILVNGIDDMQTGVPGSLENVEAGSVLHGIVVCRVPFLPPALPFLPPLPIALIKFQITGKYNRLEQKEIRAIGTEYTNYPCCKPTYEETSLKVSKLKDQE